ncbi:MAG: hypothetical protein RID96_18385 [Nitratireductor sp.]|jgi:hypothetical protein
MFLKRAAQCWKETPLWIMIDPCMYVEADMAYEYAVYPGLCHLRRRIAASFAGDAALAGSTY